MKNLKKNFFKVFIHIMIMIIKRNLCNEVYKGGSPRYKFTEKRQPFLVQSQASFQEHETFSLYFSLNKHQRKLISLPLRQMGLKKSIAAGRLFTSRGARHQKFVFPFDRRERSTLNSSLFCLKFILYARCAEESKSKQPAISFDSMNKSVSCN